MMSKRHIIKLIVLSLIIIISSLSPEIVMAQDTGGSDSISAVEGSDTKKEELQRYIGYEVLLYRYLSLPYDIVMNINERGSFVDIGFLLLMFLPLFILGLIKEKSKLSIVTLVMMFIIAAVACANSFIYYHNGGVNSELITITNGIRDNNLSHSFTKNPIAWLVDVLYVGYGYIFQLIDIVISPLTGEKDNFTYPFLILLFIGIGYLVYSQFKNSKNQIESSIALMFYCYGFYWLLLSSGIVWYGFLMMIFGTMLLFILLNKIGETDPIIHKVLSISFYVFTAIWVFMAITSRISNVSQSIPSQIYGKTMINPVFYEYNTGEKDLNDVIDRIYPGVSSVLDDINKNNKLIYRVGSSFTYFIDDNHNRVFQDNQLGFFNKLVDAYPSKIELTKALKASDFGYIIIDLNTTTLDKTAGKTLTKKFNLIMNFLYQNESIIPVATNRHIVLTDPNSGQEVVDPNTQQVQLTYGVFGKIVNNGSYAIFKIM